MYTVFQVKFPPKQCLPPPPPPPNSWKFSYSQRMCIAVGLEICIRRFKCTLSSVAPQRLEIHTKAACVYLLPGLLTQVSASNGIVSLKFHVFSLHTAKPGHTGDAVFTIKRLLVARMYKLGIQSLCTNPCLDAPNLLLFLGLLRTKNLHSTGAVKS